MSQESHSSDPFHQQELPPYTYVPGLTPHPVSDPRGHSFGKKPDHNIPLTTLLERGQLLLLAGYYWEAHEALEEAWIQVGRRGWSADVMKGLIKLAAGGVKCLEGNAAGAAHHFQRAAELFEAAQGVNNEQLFLSGPELLRLRDRAAELAAAPPLATEEQRAAAKSGGVPNLDLDLTA